VISFEVSSFEFSLSSQRHSRFNIQFEVFNAELEFASRFKLSKLETKATVTQD